MLDGLIFDVDGTLWDSTDLVAKAWNYVLETETNLPADVTGDLLKTLFGKPMDEICLKIFKGIPVSEHPRLGDICFQKENQLLYQEPVPLYPQILETFQELSTRCLRLSPAENARGRVSPLSIPDREWRTARFPRARPLRVLRRKVRVRRRSSRKFVFPYPRFRKKRLSLYKYPHISICGKGRFRDTFCRKIRRHGFVFALSRLAQAPIYDTCRRR